MTRVAFPLRLPQWGKPCLKVWRSEVTSGMEEADVDAEPISRLGNSPAMLRRFLLDGELMLAADGALITACCTILWRSCEGVVGNVKDFGMRLASQSEEFILYAILISTGNVHESQ